jgi:hypothetical protein
VTVPLLLPLQTVAAPAADPPTVVGLTVTVVLLVSDCVQVVLVFWIPVSVIVVLVDRFAVVILKVPFPIPAITFAVAPSL